MELRAHSQDAKDSAELPRQRSHLCNPKKKKKKTREQLRKEEALKYFQRASAEMLWVLEVSCSPSLRSPLLSPLIRAWEEVGLPSTAARSNFTLNITSYHGCHAGKLCDSYSLRISHQTGSSQQLRNKQAQPPSLQPTRGAWGGFFLLFLWNSDCSGLPQIDVTGSPVFYLLICVPCTKMSGLKWEAVGHYLFIWRHPQAVGIRGGRRKAEEMKGLNAGLFSLLF